MYALNNPLSYVDPSGLDGSECGGGGSGGGNEGGGGGRSGSWVWIGGGDGGSGGDGGDGGDNGDNGGNGGGDGTDPVLHLRGDLQSAGTPAKAGAPAKCAKKPKSPARQACESKAKANRQNAIAAIVNDGAVGALIGGATTVLQQGAKGC